MRQHQKYKKENFSGKTYSADFLPHRFRLHRALGADADAEAQEEPASRCCLPR